MAKPNYHHARKQREQAKKARQQEKQQRRTARLNADGSNAPASPAEEPSPAPETVAGGGS